LNDGVAPRRCLYCFHRSILLILLNPNNSTLLWFISISCIKRLVVVYAIQGYYASHKSLVSCLGCWRNPALGASLFLLTALAGLQPGGIRHPPDGCLPGKHPYTPSLLPVWIPPRRPQQPQWALEISRKVHDKNCTAQNPRNMANATH